MSFAEFGAAAPDEDVSSSEEEEEEEKASDEEDAADADAGDEEADDILGQLVEMFKAENGREPTEEEVAQWVQTLKEAAAEEGSICETEGPRFATRRNRKTKQRCPSRRPRASLVSSRLVYLS